LAFNIGIHGIGIFRVPVMMDMLVFMGVCRTMIMMMGMFMVVVMVMVVAVFMVVIMMILGAATEKVVKFFPLGLFMV
jgi:hypothetical protein